MKILSCILLVISVSTLGCGPSNQAAPDTDFIDATASEQVAQAVEDEERAHQAQSLGKKKK